MGGSDPVAGERLMGFFEEIEAQIHLWPWSVGMADESIDIVDGRVEFPFYGSPTISLARGASLILPSRYERFLPLGTAFPPGTSKYQVYEAPYGMLAGDGRSGNIRAKTGSGYFAVTLAPIGALPRLVAGDGSDGSSVESGLARSVLAWSQFFDDLLDEAGKNWQRGENVPWGEVWQFIGTLGSDGSEPRMGLIVKIADQIKQKMPGIVQGARKILLRERQLLPTSRVSETDIRCLDWLIRQPGRTVAEKGGHKQRIMAVTRRESFNTLENQVLKDFIRRCRKESARYLQNEVGFDPNFRQSKRARLVASYQRLCGRLLNEPNMEEISRPSPNSGPNYVLQNDLRYREMWRWYSRLLKREDEEDRFWDWQTRAWSDITRFLVNAAMVMLKEQYPKTAEGEDRLFVAEIAQSLLHLRREQAMGCRIVPGSEPGPFLVSHRRQGKLGEASAVLEIVHPRDSDKHYLAKLLGRTGGHQFLVLNSLGGVTPQQKVIVVWGVHTAGAGNVPQVADILASADRALKYHSTVLGERRSGFPRLSGLVLCSRLEDVELGRYSNKNGVSLVSVPADPLGWGTAVQDVKEALKQTFESLL